MEVLERLVQEDDGSVEAWYLGGWGLFLMGEKKRREGGSGGGGGRDENESVEGGVGRDGEEAEIMSWTALMVASREWLGNSLRLYELREYEDERLREHAVELVEGLDKELGGVLGDGEEEEGGEWEDEEEDGDEEDEEDDQEGIDLKMNGT